MMDSPPETAGNDDDFFSRFLVVLSLPGRWIRWLLLTRPIRFTRLGTFYILFSLGVGAAAINTGNNLLYLILGILLGFIIVSGFLSDSGLWGVRSEWLPQGSCYAGRPVAFEAQLSKGWFPGIALEVTAQWSGIPSSRQLVFWIPSRGATSLRQTLTPLRRGWLSLENIRYASRFPFGLFEKSHREMRDEKWLVYPAVKRLSLISVLSGGTDRSNQAAEKAGLGSAPFSLRDYREGDSARRIHWKSTAKTGRLLVNEMEEESEPGELLCLSHGPGGLNSEEQESLVSFAASLAFTLHENHRPVGLSAPGFYLAPENSRENLHRILSYLALINFQETTKPLPPHANGIDVLSLWKKETHAARA